MGKPPGLDLFFKGMQNKETTASAWLATLLRDDAAFRRAFFARLALDAPVDPDAEWYVRIETPLGSGFCDVTLESADTYVLIENKVSSSAVTPGQFADYHRAVLADPAHATRRIVGVYLAPRADMGSAELTSVEADTAHIARRATTGAFIRAISWQDDLEPIVAASEEPGEWFARAGLAAILEHIAKLQRGRPFAQQRQDLAELLRRVAARLVDEGRLSGRWDENVRFAHWGSRGQAALYTPGQAITTWLTLTYPETEQYEVGDVVVAGVATVRAAVSFNPSSKVGLRDPTLMSRWSPMVERRSVEVPGLGEVPARDDVAFELAVPFAGPLTELEDLLVRWGTSVLTFLQPLR